MDIDLEFPALSRLSADYGQSLKGLAARAQDHPGFISLGDCCFLVQAGAPSWSHADCHDYLKTLNVFLENFIPPTLNCREFWRKISNGSETQFLDTVAEAAWAIHFRDRGITIDLDVRIAPNTRNRQDADFRIGAPGHSLWLDVNSIEVAPREPKGMTLRARPSRPRTRESVVALAMRKAVNKYKEKFENAIRSGPLQGQPVGVLLGFMKAEMAIMPVLMNDLEQGVRIPPPLELFSDLNPGLVAVWGFNLTRADSGAYLVPNLILPWSHPDFEQSQLPALLQPNLLRIEWRQIPGMP
jgi:hypothetical protein